MNKQASRVSKATINTAPSSMVNKLKACDHGLEAVRQGKKWYK